MRILINNSLPAWLFIFCAIVFATSLGGDFVMDDWPVLKENSKISDTQYIPDYFTKGVWSNTDLANETGLGDHSLYRPLFLLTLNMAHHLWGDNALGYHVLSLILHGINTILVYLIISSFLSPSLRMVSGMSAALFAVHPVHVASVAWIAGITDPLMSLFLLSGFLLHRRASQQPHILPAVGASLCYGLALLCKETAILFPLVLLTYDALFHRSTLVLKTTAKANLGRYAAYLFLLIIYFMLRSNALDGGDMQQVSVWSRMDFQHWPVLFEFLAHYAETLIFPWPLEYYYDAPATGVLTLIVGGLFIIGALGYLPRAIKKQQYLFALAVVWIVATLLPAMPIALFAEPVYAPRVLYLPSAGFAMLIGFFIAQAQRQTQAIAASTKVIAIVFLFAFAMSSMTEIEDWKDDTTFYIEAMKSNPGSFKPVSGLAAAYARKQNTDPAIDLYLKAAKLAPQERNQLDFTESAARISGQAGKITQSEKLYGDIVRRDPLRSSAWVGLGNNALARNDQQQALEYYQKAYQADPNNRIASYNLALVYQRLGNRERAAYFQRQAQQP